MGTRSDVVAQPMCICDNWEDDLSRWVLVVLSSVSLTETAAQVSPTTTLGGQQKQCPTMCVRTGAKKKHSAMDLARRACSQPLMCPSVSASVSQHDCASKNEHWLVAAIGYQQRRRLLNDYTRRAASRAKAPRSVSSFTRCLSVSRSLCLLQSVRSHLHSSRCWP